MSSGDSVIDVWNAGDETAPERAERSVRRYQPHAIALTAAQAGSAAVDREQIVRE